MSLAQQSEDRSMEITSREGNPQNSIDIVHAETSMDSIISELEIVGRKIMREMNEHDSNLRYLPSMFAQAPSNIQEALELVPLSLRSQVGMFRDWVFMPEDLFTKHLHLSFRIRKELERAAERHQLPSEVVDLAVLKSISSSLSTVESDQEVDHLLAKVEALDPHIPSQTKSIEGNVDVVMSNANKAYDTLQDLCLMREIDLTKRMSEIEKRNDLIKDVIAKFRTQHHEDAQAYAASNLQNLHLRQIVHTQMKQILQLQQENLNRVQLDEVRLQETLSNNVTVRTQEMSDTLKKIVQDSQEQLRQNMEDVLKIVNPMRGEDVNKRYEYALSMLKRMEAANAQLVTENNALRLKYSFVPVDLRPMIENIKVTNPEVYANQRRTPMAYFVYDPNGRLVDLRLAARLGHVPITDETVVELREESGYTTLRNSSEDFQKSEVAKRNFQRFKIPRVRTTGQVIVERFDSTVEEHVANQSETITTNMFDPSQGGKGKNKNRHNPFVSLPSSKRPRKGGKGKQSLPTGKRNIKTEVAERDIGSDPAYYPVQMDAALRRIADKNTLSYKRIPVEESYLLKYFQTTELAEVDKQISLAIKAMQDCPSITCIEQFPGEFVSYAGGVVTQFHFNQYQRFLVIPTYREIAKVPYDIRPYVRTSCRIDCNGKFIREDLQWIPNDDPKGQYSEIRVALERAMMNDPKRSYVIKKSTLFGTNKLSLSQMSYDTIYKWYPYIPEVQFDIAKQNTDLGLHLTDKMHELNGTFVKRNTVIDGPKTIDKLVTNGAILDNKIPTLQAYLERLHAEIKLLDNAHNSNGHVIGSIFIRCQKSRLRTLVQVIESVITPSMKFGVTLAPHLRINAGVANTDTAKTNEPTSANRLDDKMSSGGGCQ